MTQPSARSGQSTARTSRRRKPLTAAPPPYDAAAVGRVAGRIEIQAVDLVGSHFERADDSPLPDETAPEPVPTLGIGGVEWRLSHDSRTLGCAINFAATFGGEARPYGIYARFRLTYTVEEGPELEPGDLDQFANWNVVFNAWPYWREYVASVVQRSNLPAFVVPVMGVPRPTAP